jgi:hypothetical protein
LREKRREEKDTRERKEKRKEEFPLPWLLLAECATYVLRQNETATPVGSRGFAGLSGSPVHSWKFGLTKRFEFAIHRGTELRWTWSSRAAIREKRYRDLDLEGITLPCNRRTSHFFLQVRRGDL